MDAGGGYNPRTVEEVFGDFKGRRAGMIKALTTEVEEFYHQCDPEKENLCLYGFPSEQWEVNLPAEEVPPELPEPALGINFARDGMQEKDWLSLVAVHSDAWLLSVAFYFGARFGFDKSDRKRLFNMINELPTIFEVVTGTTKKQAKEKSSVSNHSSSKSKSNSKRGSETQAKFSKAVQSKDEEDEGLEEEDEEEHGETLNGSMESVLRSPQQGLSTLNSTNAHLVATRELGLDDGGTGDCSLVLPGGNCFPAATGKKLV
ncbi:hypothetical protein CUMW_029260 [Citrus unshiu]|nr:hypothetical protein CUMW_029260 [Citrus unshiu]